jgi:hypothetical protein
MPGLDKHGNAPADDRRHLCGGAAHASHAAADRDDLDDVVSKPIGAHAAS